MNKYENLNKYCLLDSSDEVDINEEYDDCEANHFDYREESNKVNTTSYTPQKNKDIQNMNLPPIIISTIISKFLPMHSNMYYNSSGRHTTRRKNRSNIIYESAISAAIDRMIYIDLVALKADLKLNKIKCKFSTADTKNEERRVMWYCLEYLVYAFGYKEKELINYEPSYSKEKGEKNNPPEYLGSETTEAGKLMHMCWMINVIISNADLKETSASNFCGMLSEMRAVGIVLFAIDKIKNDQKLITTEYMQKIIEFISSCKNINTLQRYKSLVETLCSEFVEWKTKYDL
jgi:hypothetical protein